MSGTVQRESAGCGDCPDRPQGVQALEQIAYTADTYGSGGFVSCGIRGAPRGRSVARHHSVLSVAQLC